MQDRERSEPSAVSDDFPIRFIGEEIVIDKPVQTAGGHVLIACRTLKFLNGSYIDTGYPQPALAGLAGKRGGNILILANTIESISLKTCGQKGGKGLTGSSGNPGIKGDAGSPGIDATCRPFSKPNPATNGGKGGDGGDGGYGGIGGTGFAGGESGSVTIRYVAALYDMVAPPLSVNLSGGSGGEGGDGGRGGRGGSGGDGGTGGLGATCSVRSMHIDSEPEEVSVTSADDGPRGNRGADGTSGMSGLPATGGAPGHWRAERYQSEDEYFDAILMYLPSLAVGQTRKAELLMMLNRRKEAEDLLKEIIPLTQGTKQKQLELLLLKFEPKSPLNYYNKSVFWAPVLLKEDDRKQQILKTPSDLRADLESISNLLGEASIVARYRAEGVYRAVQAVSAYEFEKRQIEDRIRDIKNRIERAPAELAALVERFQALEAQALALKTRVVRLVSQLAELPDEIVQKSRDLLESVTSMALNVGGAVTAASAGQWAMAGGFVLNGLADLQKSIDTAQDLLNLKLNIENSISQAQQELAQIGIQLNNADNEIRRLVSQQVEDIISNDSLVQTQGLLTSFQANQDLQVLRRLQKISEDALWSMRVSVAEQLHTIRRFIDLRLGRADAVQPMNPPGGVCEAFSYNHLLSILAEIKRIEFRAPLVSVLNWESEISGENFKNEFDRLSKGELTNFAITYVPTFLAKGRVRSVIVSLRDNDGLVIGGYFELSQSACRRVLLGGETFEFDKTAWIFGVQQGKDVRSDERFSYRGIDACWSLKILSTDKREVSVAAIRFGFEVEVTSGLTSQQSLYSINADSDERITEKIPRQPATFVDRKSRLDALCEIRAQYMLGR